MILQAGNNNIWHIACMNFVLFFFSVSHVRSRMIVQARIMSFFFSMIFLFSSSSFFLYPRFTLVWLCKRATTIYDICHVCDFPPFFSISQVRSRMMMQTSNNNALTNLASALRYYIKYVYMLCILYILVYMQYCAYQLSLGPQVMYKVCVYLYYTCICTFYIQ